MKKFDFLTKTLVDSFSYTTSTQDRETYTEERINGRKVLKFGTLQAVTVVGNLYEDCYGNRILMCGVSKQHPCDSKCNKQLAYETAQAHALFKPDIVINTVPKYMNSINFRNMVEWYVDGMDLCFLKTTQEIINSGDDPKKYNR